MINTYTGYQLITRDLDVSIKRVQSQPMVQRETEYYLENITKVKSIDDFLGNDRLFRYAMKAHGMEDMTYAKAFIRKALEEGIDNRDSFANKLTDTRYKSLVETFNFERHGENTTIFDRAQQGTVDKYLRQVLEEDAGSQNEGVRLALYFERKASQIDSAYNILGDPALATVVRTMLGLPDAIAQLDVDKQAALIESRINLEDFKDPKKLAEMITRFTSLWEVNNPSTPPQSMITNLFQPPMQFGISADVLMTIAKMKR
ncbi:MAG: DUF1217 domain-containing protein [Aliihoeflea sp.]